jgi:hypothetical protein
MIHLLSILTSQSDDLPGSSALTRWLFEQPALTSGLVIAVALIGGWAFMQRAHTRWALGTLTLGAVLAGGVWLSSTLMETLDESLRSRSLGFVEAMATGEAARARAHVEPGAILAGAGSVVDDDLQGLTDYASQAEQLIGDWRFVWMGSERDGPRLARSRFRVNLAWANGTPVPTVWEATWRETDGTWSMRRLEALEIWNNPPGNLLRRGLSDMGVR